MKGLISWLVGLVVWLVGLAYIGHPAYVAGGVVSFLLGAGAVVFWGLAPGNRFFTFVKEGTAKIIVKGDGFAKALIQWKDYTLDEEWNVIEEGWYKDRGRLEVLKALGGGKLLVAVGAEVEEWTIDGVVMDGETREGFAVEVLRVIDEPAGILEVEVASEDGEVLADVVRGAIKSWVAVKTTEEVEGAKEYKEPRHPFGGLRLYGFWPVWDVFIYKFRWTSVTENGKIDPKEKWLDYTLVKDDIYFAKIEEAEDNNLLPLKVELLLTIWISNPYKAIFKIQNWLEAVVNRIKPVVRSYTTSKEFKALIQERDVLGIKLMAALDHAGLLREFSEQYGVGIRKVEVKEINPPEGFREKTLAPYVANLGKQALIITSEGERDSAIIKAEGEKKRIERVFRQIEEFGDLGKLIRALEAVEKSPLASSLLAVPGLQELFRTALGKEPSAVTLEEIKQLRQVIEQIKQKVGA